MTTTTLRAVTHRLTTTPVEQLPSIASFLATSLSDCAELLSAPQNQKLAKTDSDHVVQIHKLKTRLASLLQDRSIEARWTAVVLVKAAVEAGQWEILRGYEPIVRNLITILAKPDPISTRKMCIITLTRIFHLTYQYPTLVREITTPHMPGFVTAALNLISTLVKLPSGSTRTPKHNTCFMETVLHAILELIPRHPTIFRPFGSQIRSLVTEILSAASPAYYPEPVVNAAEQVFASLHKCAPKDKSGAGWTDDCRSTVLSIHRATDHVFRAIVEQWESVDATLTHMRPNYSSEMADEGVDALGLSSWSGMHAGIDRLIILMKILSNFITMPSTAAVAIPLGSILDVTSRLTSVIAPSDESSQTGVQINPQISRDEREMLWTELPRIHAASMSLLAHVVAVLEIDTTPLTQTMVEQITWVIRNEKTSKEVRLATYELLRSLVSLNGPAMTKQTVASIANVARLCCNDLLPQLGENSQQTKAQSDSKSKSKTAPGTANVDAFLNPDLQKNSGPQFCSRFPRLELASSKLLQSILANIPSELLAPSVRAEIDRTIILTDDKDAMLASVLNPVPAAKGRGAGSSIMPLLVRSHPEQMEVEALVRPRMPVLMSAPELDAYTEMEEDEEADEIVDEEYNAAPETAEFLTQPSSIPAETKKSESLVKSPVNKRTYFEQSTTQLPSISVATEPPAQAKKARIEETTSSSRIAVAQVSTTVSQPQKQNKATPALTEEDSDDELPTLNIDPDTDEEDDEEDVTMED
ncbi:hypothetical protein N7495_001112 [Penicillium taxi]|uniref:uncharacterized protein n=1 Tax=Penicillium taxi TaxID=168475 RepID=UPI002545675B|nr:uncharacterized protein N7495_001112 [Penicillium taxi]KAJ5908430.1 hypothetical protein N7495_001112 [Penicillium taxi]